MNINCSQCIKEKHELFTSKVNKSNDLISRFMNLTLHKAFLVFRNITLIINLLS